MMKQPYGLLPSLSPCTSMHKVGIDRDVELGDLHHDSGGVSAEQNHLASVLSDLIRLSLDAQQLNHVNNNNNFYYPY